MGSCTVADCPAPHAKRAWCEKHYRRWLKNGDPTVTKNPHSARLTNCASCGAADIQIGRKFCSPACSQHYYREKRRTTALPPDCAQCGTPLAFGRMDGRTVGRRHKRFCDACRVDVSRRRRARSLAVHILAHYQGTDCGICGEVVDMTLQFPDKRCATIDHILPMAAGGSPDEVSNLRLAHYDCNCRREAYWVALSKAAT